jgi:hypothetical protein
MARQKELAGVEKESVKEIEAAAEAYVDARDKRMRLTEKEVEAKTTLIEVMRKHKRTVYRDDNAAPPLLITLKEGAVSVKVTTVDGVMGEGDEEE